MKLLCVVLFFLLLRSGFVVANSPLPTEALRFNFSPNYANYTVFIPKDFQLNPKTVSISYSDLPMEDKPHWLDGLFTDFYFNPSFSETQTVKFTLVSGQGREVVLGQDTLRSLLPGDNYDSFLWFLASTKTIKGEISDDVGSTPKCTQDDIDIYISHRKGLFEGDTKNVSIDSFPLLCFLEGNGTGIDLTKDGFVESIPLYRNRFFVLRKKYDGYRISLSSQMLGRVCTEKEIEAFVNIKFLNKSDVAFVENCYYKRAYFPKIDFSKVFFDTQLQDLNGSVFRFQIGSDVVREYKIEYVPGMKGVAPGIEVFYPREIVVFVALVIVAVAFLGRKRLRPRESASSSLYPAVNKVAV